MSKDISITVKEWFDKASQDEKSIKALLKYEEGSTETVCFLAQQMAEKYLKGYLISKNIMPPKIHVLYKLLELCIAEDNRLALLKNETILLNGYYINTRYPEDQKALSWEEATNAYKLAVRVKKTILKLL